MPRNNQEISILKFVRHGQESGHNIYLTVFFFLFFFMDIEPFRPCLIVVVSCMT